MTESGAAEQTRPKLPGGGCPHWSSRLDWESLQTRFARDQRFRRRLFSESPFPCAECQEERRQQQQQQPQSPVAAEEIQATPDRLWACLECPQAEALNCWRPPARKHNLAHARRFRHLLAINLHTRQIWCFACNDQVRDLPEAELRPEALEGRGPQHIRDLLLARPLQPPEEKTVRTKRAKHVEDVASAAAAAEQHESPPSPSEEASSPSAVVAPGSPSSSGSGVPQSLELPRLHPGAGTIGLANLGNTCYMNSSLQALLHVPSLLQLLLSADTRLLTEPPAAGLSSMVASSTTSSAQHLLDNLVQLAAALWRPPAPGQGSEFPCLAPRQMLRSIWTACPQFRNYAQHDAQEFIRSVLGFLDDATSFRLEYDYLDLAASPSAAAESPDQESPLAGTPSSSQASSQEPSSSAGRRLDSVFEKLFGGEFQSEVLCEACSNRSYSSEPFFDISLELPKEAQLKRSRDERGNAVMTSTPRPGLFSSLLSSVGLGTPPVGLETCLHAFCTSEELRKREQYRCDTCKAKVDALKVISIRRLPQILVFQIKRFSHNSYFGSKLSRHVQFPVDHLDMASFLSVRGPALQDGAPGSTALERAKGSTVYDLAAVVRHTGGTGNGHYVAYARNFASNRWFKYDDDHVKEVTADHVQDQQAYVLVYERRKLSVVESQVPLRLVRQSQIPEDLKIVFPELEEAEGEEEEQPASLPVTETRLVSRLWLWLAQLLSTPPPVDNRDLCCRHGRPVQLPTRGGDRAIRITKAGWDQLVQRYGGGPELIGDPADSDCAPCLQEQLRDRECRELMMIDRNASRRQKQPGAPEAFCIVHAPWLKQWHDWSKGAVDIGKRPGPISNHLLFEADGTLRPGLERRRDYQALHQAVWEELLRIYGGGPAVVRASPDVYGPAFNDSGEVPEATSEPKLVVIGAPLSSADSEPEEASAADDDDAMLESVPSSTDPPSSPAESSSSDQDEYSREAPAAPQANVAVLRSGMGVFE